MIVNDNGTEFTCTAILSWAAEQGVAWHYIAPGKLTRNGFVENFNGRMRTNGSTGRCSLGWTTLARSLLPQPKTTTPKGLIHRSATTGWRSLNISRQNSDVRSYHGTASDR